MYYLKAKAYNAWAHEPLGLRACRPIHPSIHPSIHSAVHPQIHLPMNARHTHAQSKQSTHLSLPPSVPPYLLAAFLLTDLLAYEA